MTDKSDRPHDPYTAAICKLLLDWVTIHSHPGPDAPDERILWRVAKDAVAAKLEAMTNGGSFDLAVEAADIASAWSNVASRLDKAEDDEVPF